MQKLITPYAASYGKPNVVINHFPDTESCVMIPGIKSLKNKKVVIYHRLYPEPDKRLFELLLILSRIGEETKDIELFTPYLPYARQDKSHREGEVVSADVLCGLLKANGVKKLTTYDCHFLPSSGIFKRCGLDIENRSAGPNLFAYAKKYFGKDKFILISPDQGSSYFVENAEGFALHKKRSRIGKNGVRTEVRVVESEIVVGGRNICMLDDIIASGGTIIRAMEHLKKKGAKKIIVGATHGVFCGEKVAENILKNDCSRLFIADTIPCENKRVNIVRLS